MFKGGNEHLSFLEYTSQLINYFVKGLNIFETKPNFFGLCFGCLMFFSVTFIEV